MELVRLTTQDVGKAIPVTDSLIISEKVGMKHFQIMRLIKHHFEDFREFGAIDFQSHLHNSKKVEVAILNENHFYLLITYFRSTKKRPEILKLKKELVKQFSLMKSELQFRKETRNLAVKIRKELTDSIKDNVTDDGKFKSFAYSTYSKLVYKKVLGKDVKKLKEERGLKVTDNLRNFLTLEEIEKVQEVESKIATLIESWKMLEMTDKEIYEMIKQKI